MAKGEPLFHFRLTPLVLRMLGLDPEAAKRLLKKKGLPESAAEGPCSVPLSRVRALLDEAQILRGPASFGVALAAAASDGTYGMAELIGRSSETIEEGLRALTRFGPLINPIGRFEVVGEERCELHYHVLGSREGLGPVLNEFTVAYILNAFERAATGPVRPEAVWVSHSPPAIRELNEHFGVPVRKGAASCGFALSWETARTSLNFGDPVVRAFLVAKAEEQLSSLDERPFIAVVEEMLEQRLGYAASLSEVARALGLTVRTAQRRLAEEGTSYRKLVDGARRRRAEQLLSAGASLSRVAEALGFTSPGGLRRALKRWS